MNPPTDEDLAAWEGAGIWQMNELIQEVRRLRIWQEKASGIMDNASTEGAKLEADRDQLKKRDRWEMMESVSLTDDVGDVVVTVKRGDIVVVRPKTGRLDRLMTKVLREQLEAVTKQHGITFLVVEDSLDLTVLRKDEVVA